MTPGHNCALSNRCDQGTTDCSGCLRSRSSCRALVATVNRSQQQQQLHRRARPGTVRAWRPCALCTCTFHTASRTPRSDTLSRPKMCHGSAACRGVHGVVLGWLTRAPRDASILEAGGIPTAAQTTALRVVTCCVQRSTGMSEFSCGFTQVDPTPDCVTCSKHLTQPSIADVPWSSPAVSCGPHGGEGCGGSPRRAP